MIGESRYLPVGWSGSWCGGWRWRGAELASAPRRVAGPRTVSWGSRRAAVLIAESFRVAETCPRPGTKGLRHAAIVRDSGGNLPPSARKNSGKRQLSAAPTVTLRYDPSKPRRTRQLSAASPAIFRAGPTEQAPGPRCSQWWPESADWIPALSPNPTRLRR